ncbi:diacylglycerol O-acyltransferase 2-like [Oncorhynchus tshawytscha]|uniref:diacylglycerol O-acyltransferase 2-like n=1 Tax=Oncorhynchus tshawytscha TaxID=74940 RepID=UPI001C3E6012|nr:diacylglycerol O-acyltransferase 2-like [Oncorhynchus tshawytscha]
MSCVSGTGSVLLSALQSLLSVCWAWCPRLEKQVQVFSVMQSIVSFLIMAGRMFSCVRNWTAWTYYRDNVRIRVILIKTHNLLPNRNYILGYHPHGIGALSLSPTESNGFSAKFPGITPFVATLAGNFHMPLAREYLVSAGEDTGLWADLVPVYSFGENDVYKQLILNEGSWWRLIQRRLQKILGFAPCVFQGRGLFSPDTWGLVPFSKPINSVVGKPMEMPKISSPSQEELNHYHTMYMSSLTQLFDKHKTHFELREEDVLVIHCGVVIPWPGQTQAILLGCSR